MHPASLLLREQREQPSGWMQVSAAEGSMNVAQLSEFRGILALVEQIISSTSSSLAFFLRVCCRDELRRGNSDTTHPPTNHAEGNRRESSALSPYARSCAQVSDHVFAWRLPQP